MTTVAILGSGVMGAALAVPLVDNGHEVRLVGTHLDREIIDSVKTGSVHPGLNEPLPPSVRAYQLEEAPEAFAGAEIVLSGVNSFGVHWASEQLARLLPDTALVIAIAKGLEADDDGELRTLPEVLTERWSEAQRAGHSVCAITGPSIAGEVAARRETCVVFAGRDESPSTGSPRRSARTPIGCGPQSIWSAAGARHSRTATRWQSASQRECSRLAERPIVRTVCTTTRQRCLHRVPSRCGG